MLGRKGEGSRGPMIRDCLDVRLLYKLCMGCEAAALLLRDDYFSRTSIHSTNLTVTLARKYVVKLTKFLNPHNAIFFTDRKHGP